LGIETNAILAIQSAVGFPIQTGMVGGAIHIPPSALNSIVQHYAASPCATKEQVDRLDTELTCQGVIAAVTNSRLSTHGSFTERGEFINVAFDSSTRSIEKAGRLSDAGLDEWDI
jgi:hypothetical protein